MLETSNFVHGSATWSLSLVMSHRSLSGHGQSHVNNFYIVDLENVQQVVGIYYIYVHKVDAQRINIKWRAWPQARLAMGPAGSSWIHAHQKSDMWYPQLGP